MPEIEIPRKLQPILTTRKRIVVLLGGRGSAKSESIGRHMLKNAQTEGADVLCGREFQNSIEDSVHKLLSGLIAKLEVQGATITEKKIEFDGGGGFRYKGFNRSPESVKSAQDFKYAWIEEAQTISQRTIDELLPTIRSAGSQIFFSANPKSSGDPFSKRFINPYLKDLLTKGYYEDEMHLIIWMNWRDNPWFPEELDLQRQWDYDNLTRAKYDHIWEGAFDDGIEDALIQPEWFDACIDAHKVLGFDARGMIMASHDPSDEGSDSKGFAVRHGSVVIEVCEKSSGNVNDGCDWATTMALDLRVDGFTWDCDGMGVALNKQVTTAFHGKHTKLAQFKGSEGVDFPDAIFEPADGQPVQDQKTNKQAIRNKRAQYYLELRRRVINTYNAVVNKRYCDPDKMISFCSSINCMAKLKSEMCRMPIKHNTAGLFELYTKEEMKRKFKVDSPNLADSVMMLMRQPYSQIQETGVMPQPIRPIGRR